MFFLTGCWNYREVDNLLIIAGIAIDKNQTTNKYVLTAETLKLSSGKDNKIEPELIEAEGDSIFDAIRNTMQVSGQKLYWAHMDTVVISQKVAKEGITPILDILGREPEPRLNLLLVISKAETAKEILTQKTTADPITSLSIAKMIRASESNPKTIVSKLYKVIDDLGTEGVSVAISTVSVIKSAGKEALEASGVAVFKKDKLIGFLDDIESRSLLYTKDQLKGGLIYVNVETEKSKVGVTLEIIKNKTKIKPEYTDGKIVINIDVDTDAIIGEFDSTEDLLNEKGIEKIKESAQKTIESDIQNLIKKVQNEYDSDIFGFGENVKGSMPSHWREVSSDWDSYFKTLEVKVKSKVNITGSTETNSPIKVGG